ncbi:MAG: metal ABC transporter permease [Bacteroidales bacterium]
MNWILSDLWQFDFFRNAMLTAFLAAVSCGLAGTYIVSRRMVFISGGLTHASFGGIGIGYFFGFNPILGAALFAVLSALGIEYASKRISVREDSAIAILWSFGMAVGIIFVFLTPGYAPNLMNYLFGSILTVSREDICFLLGLTIIMLVFFIFFFRLILFTAFDENFAITRRMPVQFINYSMMILIALTMVFNIRVAGIILVLSLLTIPQTIASIFTHDFFRMAVISMVAGWVGIFGGLMFSYSLDIPSGASIIFLLVILFFIARLISYFLHRKAG